MSKKQDLQHEIRELDALVELAQDFLDRGGSPLSSLRMGVRPDTLAERCLERKNLSFLLKRLGGSFRGKALVVAAGLGREGHLLLEAGFQEVHLLDLSLSGVNHGLKVLRQAYPDRKIHALAGDFTSMPYSDGFFDIALAYQGLHHLPDQVQGAAELIRVSRKAFILSEPARLGGFMGTLMNLLGWNTEYGGLETGRIDPVALASELQKMGFQVEFERIWQYFPACLSNFAKNGRFVAAWFAMLSVLDRFLPPEMAHATNIFIKRRG
ncbi:MAG: hypothetical protein CVV64_17720 [Candidatus Wallbacteria bacterium HGW-Wallbacteria-1]|uniref:Methyltransferase type 11 domain-containing protein n=1 Tax=Candidatus Wallbacteria bacterium HGW-Wallbacteria-1 TaxID=2013854 RepID=A0A2N1PK26_9BACT|nr:MAG: hypothetical protein CVV64_17720 [Candidatus Wallbacteria bacterium HGW-Wallbacteria-1]